MKAKKISNLRDFSCHPFKVVKDAAMYELMESIRQEGVLVPLLVRPVRMKIETEGGEGKLMDEKEKEYEIIAGHRRKTAAEWAGLREVPAIVPSRGSTYYQAKRPMPIKCVWKQ